ncbi:hypothetical protein [Litorilituus lipolyticus]|uniref:Uncharacterized protein n=1 Tax=Litorilituus lipolyticus TaxID=2491017 RepID=A0A502L8C3_9GAMM|nr:hypothetical protein [Litorilituus lipolyticus]TPH18591.1 hypothetical protein EPA86_02250 [Litorilituus lipolyticus]
MTIPTITSTTGSQYYPTNTREQQLMENFHNANSMVKGSNLSPEQKSSVQESFTEKHAEQVENIKSNYQVAKDITLTQAYYEQQQKLLDIYLQSSHDDSKDSDSFNAVGTLTDMYSLMLDLHKQVRGPIEDMPSIGRPTLYSIENNSPNDKQMRVDLYNQTSQEPNGSYLHLSA